MKTFDSDYSICSSFLRSVQSWEDKPSLRFQTDQRLWEDRSQRKLLWWTTRSLWQRIWALLQEDQGMIQKPGTACKFWEEEDDDRRSIIVVIYHEYTNLQDINVSPTVHRRLPVTYNYVRRWDAWKISRHCKRKGGDCLDSDQLKVDVVIANRLVK